MRVNAREVSESVDADRMMQNVRIRRRLPGFHHQSLVQVVVLFV